MFRVEVLTFIVAICRWSMQRIVFSVSRLRSKKERKKERKKEKKEKRRTVMSCHAALIITLNYLSLNVLQLTIEKLWNSIAQEP